ncbi:thiol-disulfide oxidoreductase DCC family protein [Streptacidiphilus albus]|uniref:thiol-disulfide oxidoreductase DCC family protein n=1 Tax=Streptacidiphilus albus TaxID=105425 RepID=UPI0009DE45F5|nr:DCC1-like thiol-disulfide oxidoreductase family protein [Streptacidiphilus albus]
MAENLSSPLPPRQPSGSSHQLPPQPVLLFDGDCAFCSSSVRFAERRLDADRWEAVPFQFADLDALAAFTGGLVSPERAEHEVLWITPTGRVYGGAQAAARLLLRTRRPLWSVLGALLTLPLLRQAAAGVYRVVAVNRHRMPGGTAACALPPAARRAAAQPPAA